MSVEVLAGAGQHANEITQRLSDGIAAQLYITVRTVTSHLDRVRDKTGCRRRADLTRLALGAGLV